MKVIQGDLTNENVDAIVNAANTHLAHGGGVAGAIVKKGGRVIQEMSDRYVRQHGSVHTGQAAITQAGKLSCKYVIHAVGPVFGGNLKADSEKLKQAVLSSYRLAEENSLSSISLPAISSGIFGFPKDSCAEVMIKATIEFIVGPRRSINEIRFVNFDSLTANIFTDEMNKFVNNENSYLRFLQGRIGADADLLVNGMKDLEIADKEIEKKEGSDGNDERRAKVGNKEESKSGFFLVDEEDKNEGRQGISSIFYLENLNDLGNGKVKGKTGNQGSLVKGGAAGKKGNLNKGK